jgi:hypothetical protein
MIANCCPAAGASRLIVYVAVSTAASGVMTV